LQPPALAYSANILDLLPEVTYLFRSTENSNES
jgi:hypothetical protein